MPPPPNRGGPGWVVLMPTMVEIGREFGASVGAVGQARAIAAASAVVASLIVTRRFDRIGLRRLLAAGAAFAVVATADAAGNASPVATRRFRIVRPLWSAAA